MDEMQLVKDMRRSTPVITEDAEAIARTRLLATLLDTEPAAPRLHHPRMRKIAWRTAVAGALAATVAVGFTVAQGLGGDHASVADAAVVKVLDHASAAAAARPFTAPRPDQWVYQHSVSVSWPGTKPEGPKADIFSWIRASGSKEYVREPGLPWLRKLTLVPPVTFPPRDYTTLSRLPTNSKALLGWISAHRPASVTNTDFEVLSDILEDGGVLPPKVEVAIFQAMKRLPGVTIRRGVTDLLGKRTIAVVGAGDGSIGGVPFDEAVLLDRATYVYLGNEAIMTKDLYIPGIPQKGAKPYTIKAGTLVSAGAVMRSGIVDKPGQTP